MQLYCKECETIHPGQVSEPATIYNPSFYDPFHMNSSVGGWCFLVGAKMDQLSNFLTWIFAFLMLQKESKAG